MRRLILHRERALACFAMKYHCILDRDRDGFLHELKEREQGIHLWNDGECSLKNGQTIQVELSEGEHTFFVVACLDGRDMATEPVVIRPGEEDVYWTVRTDYDGSRRLGILLLPTEQ